MIFLSLFWVFSQIGIVNFGGGYAMLSLIHAQIVVEHGWMTNQEFTDIVAISQMTPGPIGVNVATYVGYTAVINQGYSPFWAVLGSLIATLSVLWLPFTLMLLISRFLLRNKDSVVVQSVFSGLRPAIVGLIATAALLLMTEENFGNPRTDIFQFLVSLLLFALAFVAIYRYRISPLIIIGVAGLLGCLVYGFF